MGARPPHQSIGSSSRASPRWVTATSAASAAASSSATARAGDRPACRARAWVVRSTLSTAVSGTPGRATPRPAARSDALAARCTATSWTVHPASSGGSTRRAQSSAVRSREQQDDARELDPVDLDRRGAGQRLGRRPAAAGLGQRPGAEAVGGRDVVDDRGRQLARGRPQRLRGARGLGVGPQVGRDRRVVAGVVGVEGVGRQVVEPRRAAGRVVVHVHSSLTSGRRMRAMRARARRIRDLAVPSGMSSASATCL